jgi:hypothetical protein
VFVAEGVALQKQVICVRLNAAKTGISICGDSIRHLLKERLLVQVLNRRDEAIATAGIPESTSQRIQKLSRRRPNPHALVRAHLVSGIRVTRHARVDAP